MKSIVPWFCLAAMTNANLVFADAGLDAYRLGDYDKAADLLIESKSKDPVVDYYLGKMRLYGYGELKNNKLAIEHLQKAADKGLLSAQKIMARYELLETGNFEKALYWFKKAAATDDTSALMYCAAAYFHGLGTKVNRDVARKYYIAAAKNGNSIAQYSVARNFLKSRHSSNKKLGMIWLNKAVDKHNPEAQLLLANQYMYGKMVDKDFVKARDLINLSVDQHYLPAYYTLGELEYLEKNYDKAQKAYAKAASANYIPAIIKLSELYANEKTDLFSEHESFLWMLKAAQLGSKSACLSLSEMYKKGQGIDQDDELAESWKKKAKLAGKKDIDAVRLSAIQWLTNRKASKFTETHYDLHGILSSWHNTQNTTQNNYNQPPQFRNTSKQELYKPKFELVHPNAISIAEYYNILVANKELENSAWKPPTYLIPKADKLTEENKILREQQHASLGFDYLLTLAMSSEGKIDYKKEFAKLEVRSEIGDMIAQFDLGQMYQYAIGVEKNTEEAVKYYKLAAEQGSLPAEYNLGIIYLHGDDDVTPNYKLALHWLTDAAFKGNDYAQFVLARIYENGYFDADGKEVIKANREQALAMYNIAAANRYGPAQYRLAEILVREKQTDLSERGKRKRNQLIKDLYARALKNHEKRAELPLAYYNAMSKKADKQQLAYEVADKLANDGNKEASLLLGLMYDRGIVVGKSSDSAVRWYQQSGENPVSAFILGTYSASGDGLSKDTEKAHDLLEKAVASNFSYANLNLAVLNKQNDLEFLDYLNTALSQSNSTAGLLLADYYLSESDDKAQLQDARKIYEQFAKQGDKDAQLKLGFLYEKGIGGKVNYAKAKDWYSEAAHQNQAQAQFLLARLYHLGKIGKSPDIQLAKKWYKKARKDFPRAAVALGFIYDTIDENYHQAITNYKFAHKRKETIGSFNLGLIYERGEGCAVDYKKARELYFEGASAGHKESMAQLGGLFLNGYGGGLDYREAYKWYNKAAELGDRGAMYQLGLFYETGVATNLDYSKAREYYQKSADLGNVKASLALARLYQYGVGGEKSLEHSVDIYEKLSKHGNAYAQYQLALLCFKGVPADCDTKRGLKWLEKSLASGNYEASTMIRWVKARQDNKLSFIQPVPIATKVNAFETRPTDLQYFDALNAWNIGNEKISKAMLYRILVKHPNNSLAKETYKQIISINTLQSLINSNKEFMQKLAFQQR